EDIIINYSELTQGTRLDVTVGAHYDVPPNRVKAVSAGAPRNARMRATVDSELLEITGEAFRQFALANPAVVEQIGVAVANRRADLEERRATGAGAAQVERRTRSSTVSGAICT